MPKKLTQKEFVERFLEQNPRDFIVIGGYSSCGNQILVKHIVCNTTFSKSAERLLQASAKCPTCDPRATNYLPKTQKQYEDDV